MKPVHALLFALCAAALLSAEENAFRTDGGDEKLPWFQLKPGEFPPENAAHYIAGELIALDHINRTGVLRPDRTDAQRRGDWDKPMNFALLSYGSLGYHGAPAELRDIPIGTHLHGWFFLEEKVDKKGNGKFERALRLEDDFTYAARRKHAWRVDTVEIDKGKLTVTDVATEGGQPQAAQPETKPIAFQIAPSTRVWKAREIAALKDLAPGQTVFLNLTVCTLKGPGRCTDIWIDDESRAIARERQLEVHRQYQREHGLPCWVDAVENSESILTVSLFDGFDPELLKEMPLKDHVAVAVGEDSLRTYDQINDVMRGPVLEILNAPAVPGFSGVRLKIKPGTLLEGYRPKRILRIFAGRWKVDDLPREEQLYQ
jgi:hypothetical protein